MTGVQVRPFVVADLPTMIGFDHSYHTDYVWQMDINSEDNQINVSFREIRLPRSMRVVYPRIPDALADDWSNRTGILVAELDDEVVGYVSLMEGIAPLSISIIDVVVMRRLRRHGLGQALLVAAQTWAVEKDYRRLIIEMQSKNYPAISLVGKLGYEFCGYSDKYYENQDLALFFSKRF
jgi:ribosomal protein S18 acetylase RimI-like enzyme